MAEKKPAKEPNLELPSFFGRRSRGADPVARERRPEQVTAPPTDATTLVRDAGPEHVAEPAPTPTTEERPPRQPRTLPEVAGSTAALVVGAAVGLLGCVLTLLGLQGCEAATGTESCGGPGLLVLAAIVVAMVLAGAAALKLLRVADSGSVSFLGVGMLTTLVLLFAIDRLDEWSMFLVVPVVSALCFLAARWVTTRYVDDVMAEEDWEPRDVR